MECFRKHASPLRSIRIHISSSTHKQYSITGITSTEIIDGKRPTVDTVGKNSGLYLWKLKASKQIVCIESFIVAIFTMQNIVSFQSDQYYKKSRFVSIKDIGKLNLIAFLQKFWVIRPQTMRRFKSGKKSLLLSKIHE